MATSKLIRMVESRTTQEMALPDQELNRSIDNSTRCIRPLLHIGRGPGRPGPRQDRHFAGCANGSDFWPRVVGRLVRDAEVDRVGPGEDLLGPGPLRLQDGDEVGVVLRFRRDDRIPRLQLVVAHRLRRLDELDAASIDHFMIDCRSFGIDSNLVLLRSMTRISLGWWYDWVMQIFRTSGRPYAVSEVVLLNSAASMTPRSSDDATSAPATEITLAPANA